MLRRIALLFAVVALVLTAVPISVQGTPTDRATGAGKINPDRTFAFAAVEHPDGTVSGQGQLVWPDLARIHFAVDCVNVEDETATVTGQVTSVEGPYGIVGEPFWFQVVDNGEGDNAPADEMTYILYPSDFPEEPFPEDCESYLLPPFGHLIFPLLSGNVQVRG